MVETRLNAADKGHAFKAKRAEVIGSGEAFVREFSGFKISGFHLSRKLT